MTLYESEIELLRVMMLGMFFGWHLCRFWYGPKDLPWTIIRNLRFPIMNKINKKKWFRK